jgi:molybdopterin-guanine dinucleotide biosynthesis protein A
MITTRNSDSSLSGNSAGTCCAVLLRGGRSRRMGRDKALLPWKESTFLETIASELDFLDEKYLSVAAAGSSPDRDIPASAAEGSEKGISSDRDSLSDDWIRLPDLIPDCGPLGGIYTALQTCRAEWALVVSCDVPAVQQSFFKMLLQERSGGVDIIYPLTPDGRMHMTCAAYRKAVAPILRQQIEKGDNRLRVLPDLCRAKAVRIEEPDLIRMISNINTGEEFDRILYN